MCFYFPNLNICIILITLVNISVSLNNILSEQYYIPEFQGKDNDFEIDGRVRPKMSRFKNEVLPEVNNEKLQYFNLFNDDEEKSVLKPDEVSKVFLEKERNPLKNVETTSSCKHRLNNEIAVLFEPDLNSTESLNSPSSKHYRSSPYVKSTPTTCGILTTTKPELPKLKSAKKFVSPTTPFTSPTKSNVHNSSKKIKGTHKLTSQRSMRKIRPLKKPTPSCQTNKPAVVKLVIHVQCDHSNQPYTPSLTNFNSNSDTTKQEVRNPILDEPVSSSSNDNISSSVSNLSTTTRPTTRSLTFIPTLGRYEKPQKITEESWDEKCSGKTENPYSKLCLEVDKVSDKSGEFSLVIPRPLQPHDITGVFKRPTPKSFKPASHIYLCQLLTTLCPNLTKFVQPNCKDTTSIARKEDNVKVETSTLCQSEKNTDKCRTNQVQSGSYFTTTSAVLTLEPVEDNCDRGKGINTSSRELEDNDKNIGDLTSSPDIFDTTLKLQSGTKFGKPNLPSTQEIEVTSPYYDEPTQKSSLNIDVVTKELDEIHSTANTNFDLSESISTRSVSPCTAQFLSTSEEQLIPSSRSEHFITESEEFSQTSSLYVKPAVKQKPMISVPTTVIAKDNEGIPNSTERYDLINLEREGSSSTAETSSTIIDLQVLKLTLGFISNSSFSLDTTTESNQIRSSTTKKIELSSLTHSSTDTALELLAKSSTEIIISSKENHAADIRNVINLGEGKFQFLWRDRWYVTDFRFIWPLQYNISSLFETTYTTQTSSSDVLSITKVIENSNTLSLPSFQIPFELFSQSVLVTEHYDETITYQWNEFSLQYTDVVAMLRLPSTRMIYSESEDLQWGQINWSNIHHKIQKAPKSSSPEKVDYEVIDFSGIKYPLIVFSNGTSIWKDFKMNKNETIHTVQQLNSNLTISVNKLSLSFNPKSAKFLNFLIECLERKIENRVIYSSYVWKTYNFSKEELEVTSRLYLINYEHNKSSTDDDDDYVGSNLITPIFNSSKEFYANSTRFSFSPGTNVSKPITVYCNGTTIFDGVSLSLVDTVNKLKGINNAEEIPEKISINSSDSISTTESPVNMKYNWQYLNNNPSMNVCYPINLGAGKVQFYMKNKWYITDGANVWPFNNMLTLLYTNEMVKQMDQRFEDDPELDINTIQKLVDAKFADCYYELVMPFQLMAQHYLFFKKYTQGDRIPVVYSLKQDSIKPEDIVAVLRLSAFNNFTTKDVQFSWASGTKLNWNWFVYLVLHAEAEQTETTRSFNFSSDSGTFANNPQLKIHLNGSSEWGVQRLNLEETLIKLQDANSKYNFSLLEINGEYKVKEVDFELFVKEALHRRFNKTEIYCKYYWNRYSFTWYELLLCVRFPELMPSKGRADDAFWESVIMHIRQSRKTNYVDRIDYEVHLSSSRERLVVFMNETTVVKGVFRDVVELNKIIRT